jgi:HAD superfamily hydrolase (TIGR01509 family)
MVTLGGGDPDAPNGTDVRQGAVEAVLFDIDGTLVDTNYLHAVAWRRGFHEAGFDVPTAWIHHRVGMGAGRLMEGLIGEERDDVKQGWRRHFDALKPEIRAFPGAEALLREVHSRGIRVVLASSSEESDLDALLAALGADDVIDCVTSAGDVGEAKPSPEVFEVAIQKASCDPDRTVVVGDSVWDVLAAKKAGLPCVCVLTGGIAAGVLLEAGAVAVYRDVEELHAELDRSRLVRDGAGVQVSLDVLPGELRSRVQAATAHATRRTIHRRGDDAFEVHALAGDRVVHMLLGVRSGGSVHETTETFVRSQILGVVLSGDRATVEFDDGTGLRSVTVPLELGEALAGSS